MSLPNAVIPDPFLEIAGPRLLMRDAVGPDQHDGGRS